MKKTVPDLLKKHPAAVILWLDNWLKKGEDILYDSEINWMGLGDSAAAYACNAYGRSTVLESILWGSIAVTVREHLAKNESDEPRKLVHAMRVRYNLVVRFGNHPGDPLCDSKIILEWFYRVVPMSLRSAQIEGQHWHTKPDGRKSEFKFIVDQLELLRNLVTLKRLQPDAELQMWLEVLERVRSGERN